MSRLSKDPTESIIENSIEIYEKEAENFKKVGNNYKCLCYHGEKTPSYNISGDYPYLGKCFGCGDSNNVIGFVAKMHDISYKEAISYIQGLKIHTKTVTHNKLIKTEKKEIIIDFVDKPFSKEDKKYWGKYGLPEDFLRDNNVYSVKTYAINKKIIKHNDERLIFAYLAPSGKCKLLFIGKSVLKEEKWKSNIESSYLWYLPKTPCNQLWVVKSVKDALCLKYHFQKCVVAVQSENSSVLDKNMPRILEISKDIVINFGADIQGVESCKPVQQKWQTKYFNTDKTMLKYGIVDPSDVIAAFGVKVLEKQLKKKNFL